MINKEEIEALEKLKCFEPDDLVECAIYLDAINIITNLIERQEDRIKELEEINEEHQKLNGELQEKLTKAENENSIMEFNYQILQGEMDRIGIDTLKLEPGSSTDDVIDEIKKMQKKLTYYEEICKGKSIQELGMSDLYKED